MKYYKKGIFWFTFSLTVFFAIVFWVSLGYSPKARFVPIILSTFMLALTVILLLGEKYPRLVSSFDGTFQVPEQKASDAAIGKDPKEKSHKRVFALAGLLIGSYISIICVGFFITIPLFVFIFCKFFGKLSWFQSFIATAIVEGIVFGLFDVLMKADLFKGIFFGDMLI